MSGLTPKGRLLASASRLPTVYSSPLVAWRPVTLSTSAVLNLRPGLWYYRVRGLNPAQVGTSSMTWSVPVAVRVARPTFRISG